MTRSLTPDELDRARRLLAELALTLSAELRPTAPPARMGEPIASRHARLLSIDDACRVLRVSRWTIYRLLREGRLDSLKVGSRRFIPATTIDRFIATAVTGEPL